MKQINKKFAVSIIILVWVVITLGFIGYKEYILATGEKVLLKTIPLDPRDILRGDYVTLTYEISILNKSLADYEIDRYSYQDPVYVTLEKQGKYYVATKVSKTKPSGLYIKGKADYGWDGIHVRYGVENLFVPEGEGLELEQYRNGEIDVEVIIDKSGNAIINKVYLQNKEINFN